jgi:predicted GIY-YIG superfamily endonuclease
VYYTYVLYSERDGGLYVGFTKDLKLRPAQLNAALQPSFAGFNRVKAT